MSAGRKRTRRRDAPPVPSPSRDARDAAATDHAAAGGQGEGGAPPAGRWGRAELVVLAFVALVFAPTVAFGFVRWDDPVHLLENPLVVGPGGASLRDHLLTPALGYPAPLPVVTYRLEHALFGLESATPYHVTQVLLHVAVCAMVFRLAWALGLRRVGACLAVLAFGVHPVVAETVSWVSGRKDVLVTLLSLATLDVATAVAQPTVRRWAATIALFVLALACKPTAIFVVPLIPLFRWARHGRGTRGDLAGLSVLAVLIALYLPVALRGQAAVQGVVASPGVGTHVRAVWYALGFHLDLALLLQETSSKYQPKVFPPPFAPIVDLVPLVVAAAMAWMVWRRPPGQRASLLAAAGLCVAAYGPNSNVVPLTRYLADTYVYIPLLGLTLFWAAVVDDGLEALRRRRPVLAWLGPVALTAVLAALALPASARYRNSLTLWEQTRRINPHDARVCQAWSTAVGTERGPAAEIAAIEDCAARFGPRLYHRNKALALSRLDRMAEALAELELALRAEPDDPALRAAVEGLRESMPARKPR